MKTSLINSQLFMDHFRPELEKGNDVVYVGLSSGVSGTLQAAKMAAEELMEEYPQRTVCVIDSLGAGFGPGLLACRAADLRNAGKTATEAEEILEDAVKHLLQIFTVDDLNFLKRTGRVSGATAAIGTILNIKPLLWGDPTGHIVALSKCRGRKKAIEAIVDIYRNRAINAQNQRVAISHGDCLEEAQLLADKICEVCKPKELIICQHEPFTGAHVGPGMLALFFFGEER
jgi:DegV family protein with EDD domain